MRANLTARRIFYVCTCMLATVLVKTAVAQECTPLKQGVAEPNTFRSGPFFKAPGATFINHPGNYCLTANFRVEGHYWPFTPEGPKLFSDGELLLLINSSDVTIDFNGHEAISDAHLAAGLMTPRRPFNAPPSKPLPDVIPRDVTIKNGRISILRHGMAVEIFGVGPQEQLVNIVANAVIADHPQLTDSPSVLQGLLDYENEERTRLRASFMSNAAAYPVRNLHIEHMHIRAQDYAVVLQGAGSVIRDSVIETDSGTALWLYGPNAIIENNTFIVHCFSRPMSYQGVAHCQKMDAPIRLMHGDGAVIRNNTFVLKDSAFKRALSLFDTGAFTFEGNTFIGLDNSARAIKAFRGPQLPQGVRPNVVDNSWFTRAKFWFQ